MLRRVLLAFLLVLLVAFPLAAQEYSKADVFGGYQLIRDSDVTLHGFKAEVAGNINSSFGIVGEFGLGMKTIAESDFNIDVKEYTYLAGPRFTYRAEQIRVFAQFLAGGSRFSGSSSDLGVSVGASSNGFAMSFGGGIDIPISPRVSVRPAQIDYLTTRFSMMGMSSWQNQFRYSGGIVFNLGTAGK